MSTDSLDVRRSNEEKMSDLLKTADENSATGILCKKLEQAAKEKALFYWSLLRTSVCSVTSALEKADVNDLSLSHGIYRERKLAHSKQVHQAVFVAKDKEYITLDGSSFRVFLEDGRKKDIFEAEEKMDRFVYSSHTDQFIGWVHGEENVYLMSKGFVILSQSKAVGPILRCIYNTNTTELITLGPHFITFWSFRYGARHLISRLTTKHEFGENDIFKMIVLEQTASKSQKMFCTFGNGVVVYNTSSGLEITRKKNLHDQPVCAISFFNPLKYLITGAKDGCIKVWDSLWKVKMVFVGHTSEITFLRIYPHGPAFMSASVDCTIRVWNMETCDEVDKTVVSEPIKGMETEMNYDVFYTFSGKYVDLWKLQHLYRMHTNVGYRINTIKVTSHPFVPTRAVLMCRDSSVRIVCPANGEVLTTLLMSPSDGLIDTAYAAAEDTLFALLRNGDIIKCRTDQNPCHIVSRWKCGDNKEMCSCLLVYEYVVDPTASGNVWGMMKRSVETQSMSLLSSQAATSKNRTLLLGGRKDGYICVFDWYSGDVSFQIEAHGSKGVLNMIANSKCDQLISAGMDNIIKVWRLFPFAEEALTPLMSFYCGHTPSFMTTIKSSLAVAFQDQSTATFSLVVYSLPDKTYVSENPNTDGFRNRFDHKPADDHMDTITGLTCCPRMKLYASSSMDGTIRIWSLENKLVRVIKINTIPHSLSFCSSKGDLLVGVGDHLCFISHEKYLPQWCRRKQACMRFAASKEEFPIEYDENKLQSMDKVDVKRLKFAHSSFKFDNFIDVLPPEEEEELLREKKIKDEAYNLLAMRDNEIIQIKDGALISKNKPKSTAKTENKAFKEYMKIYYNKERIKLPKSIETISPRIDKDDENEKKYCPDAMPYGFFGEIGKEFEESNEKEAQTSQSLQCTYPEGPTGYLPNSVLLKILFPPPLPVEDIRDKTPYKPPELTEAQLEEIASLYPRKPGKRSSDLTDTLSRSVTFAGDDRLTRVLELDFSDEETTDSKQEKQSATDSRRTSIGLSETSETGKDKSDVSAKTPIVKKVYKKKQSKKAKVSDESDEDEVDYRKSGSSSLMSKFQEIITKEPEKSFKRKTPSPEPTSPVKEQIEKPEKAVVEPPVKPAPLEPISRPRHKPRSPSPRRSPTPPRPPTPLPDFIKENIGQEWFEKYFPNCNENTMPRPWSGDNFVNMIVKLLRIAEWLHKISVLEAILLTNSQDRLSGVVVKSVIKTTLSVLNHHSNPPNCGVPEHKDFILAALQVISTFGSVEKDVIAELMVQFLDGDRDVRSEVLKVLESLGMMDPHRQFQKELDCWDVWGVDESDHQSELHSMCNQWLDRWMASYKMRISDTVDRLNKGQSIQGRLPNRGGSIRPSSKKTGSVAGDSETVTSLAGTETNPKSVEGRLSVMSQGSLTVTVDRLQDSAILETVTHVDAINYFCEIMMEKELEALRKGQTLSRKRVESGIVQAKNTVLVFPKIAHKPALVRLGEMHTSKCRVNRESDYRMPPIVQRGRNTIPGELTGFVPSINFPMKPVLINPFPSSIDEIEAKMRQPILITLKSAQKYFVPSQSYVSVQSSMTV